MSLQDLSAILKIMTDKPTWEGYRQYCHLVELWQQVVSPAIAEQTRVLSLSHGVLWVATPSAVWAQNLMLQRQDLLAKLQGLGAQVADIRFSSANWYKGKSVQQLREDTGGHPSHVGEITEGIKGAGFAAWVEQMRRLQEVLPSCPVCAAPTPVGELERWGVCRLCVNQGLDKDT
jgi:predicted nucleic acid-binding Zn ribbon protein